HIRWPATLAAGGAVPWQACPALRPQAEAAGAGGSPEALVVEGHRKAGRIAVETVELLEAVADEIGARRRPTCFDGLGGFFAHGLGSLDQRRRMEATSHDNNRALAAQCLGDAVAHVLLARKRAIGRHLGARDRR